MTILSKGNRKRHTKPCLYFQTNDCPLSARECDFAHVIATPEEYETLRNPQATLRTKPCRFFLGGQCKDGYWCRFKHPANLFAASRASDSSLVVDEDVPVPELDSDRGTDEDGDVDVRELDGSYKAKPEEHPKYRTRPCRNFILGRCAYGDRCSYLHVISPPNKRLSSMDEIATPLSIVGTAATARSDLTLASYLPKAFPHAHNAATEASYLVSDDPVLRTPPRAKAKLDVDVTMNTPSLTLTPSTSSSGSGPESGYSDDGPVITATPGTPTPTSFPTSGTEFEYENEYASFRTSDTIPPFVPPPLPSLPLQMSPLSPLSYMGQRYMAKSNIIQGRRRGRPLDYLPSLSALQTQINASSPPSSMTMFSPSSPLPVQIVHVPFAVPFCGYQEVTSPTSALAPTPTLCPAPGRGGVSTGGNTNWSQTFRTRACSQPNTGVRSKEMERKTSLSPLLPPTLPFRAKPCKFFAETGKCQKGDRCDFMHTSPPTGDRDAASMKEMARRSSEDGPIERANTTSETSKNQGPPASAGSNTHTETKTVENFYKIKWRVVGGGVKIGTDKVEHRRRSEDAALSSGRLANKNPFDSLDTCTSTPCTLGPAINFREPKQKPRSNGVVSGTADTGRQKPDLTWTGRTEASANLALGSNGELSRSFEGYSLDKMSARVGVRSISPLATTTTTASDKGPLSIVQEYGEGDTDSGRFLTVQRQDVARAKSSPSSPITPLQDLPSVVFSAESP